MAIPTTQQQLDTAKESLNIALKAKNTRISSPDGSAQEFESQDIQLLMKTIKDLEVKLRLETTKKGNTYFKQVGFKN